MKTLNTPHEIALWTSAASAFATTRTYPTADDAAQFADSMVLELRKRVPVTVPPAGDDAESELDAQPTPEAIPGDLNEQLRLAAERGQRVRAIMADGRACAFPFGARILQVI